MKETFFDNYRFIEKEPIFTEQAKAFSQEKAESALRFHKSLPVYRETPLVSLQNTAEIYGVGSIFVKDESCRFNLKAFKGLGGSYSMFRILCERLGLDERNADYSTFLREDVRRAYAGVEFVTATDGNHKASFSSILIQLSFNLQMIWSERHSGAGQEFLPSYGGNSA